VPSAGALGIGAAALGHSFTPYQPPPIPSGYYDPALDAQRDAATRGLNNTQQDVGLAGRRAGEDYGLDPSDPTYGYSAVGGIEQGFARNTQDLGTARANEGVDYGRSVEMLTRNYRQLGRQQGEQARKYGVTSGGVALLSAAKRSENQGLEQRDLDTTHQRAVQGFDTAGTRLGEDRTNALGQALTGYNRGVADRGTSLGRARAEDTFYGTDVGAQKLYQAQQAGYEAPVRGEPGGIRRNEHIIGSGPSARLHTRTQQIGAYVYTYDQNGKIVGKKRA
jgi:hypothetical protein